MKKELLNQSNQVSIITTAKRISKRSILFIVLLSFSYLFMGQVKAQGTWTKLKRLAPDPNNGVMLLLTDGTVICHTSSGGSGSTSGGSGSGSIFDRLTPDSTGSYVNGTWSQIAPMITERYSFSSAVLKNGNVYAAGGEYGADGFQAGYHGEVYNPLTNVWTAALGSKSANIISDGDCKLLDNGNILQALVNMPFPTATVIYNIATNTYVAGPSTIGGQNESMWLKLPDNSILFVDEGAETSERYIPSQNKWIADGNVPVEMYDGGEECGPAWMLPDGRAFFIGATGHTAYYTPTGNNNPGTWVAGPDVPNSNGMPDAPGAMMVNGIILFACSSTTGQEFAPPTYFYEFNYLTNTYTQVNAPTGGTSYDGMTQQFNLLDLPDGTVLCGLDEDQSSAQYYIYTPTGSPLAAGKPVIANIVPVNCTTFRITGTGFNGISEGSSFGDENENDNNYPLIRLTSGGHVYYARSFNWNSAGVQRAPAPDTAYFTLPGGMPDGTYSLVVVAVGNASNPVSFTDSVPGLSSSLTPPAICSGTAFTYTPASGSSGATFTWTRAAVTGISNAAITTPQSTNPDEVLINTTGGAVTVVYAYTISANGCSNQMNVTVSVNPPPIPSFTAEPITSCSLPDTVRFTNTTVAGGTYIWHFGDGNISSAFNPRYVYLTAGTFTVKLIATSACGVDSVTQTNLIVINSPSAPVATSPVDINCGSSATITATGSDTLQWYSQPAGGILLAKGGTYITPVLNANTTYYVETDISSAPSFCPPLTDAFGTGSSYANPNFRSNVFNVNQPCTLVSVVVYSNAAGDRTIYLTDSMENVLQSAVVNIPSGTYTVPLNFPLTVGRNYELGFGDNSTNTNLYRNETGAAFPYSDPDGYVTITGNNVPDNLHYYFCYDWKLQGPSCISPRTPVNVVISGASYPSFTYTQNGDTLTLTNTSTNSTSWLWNFGDGDTSTLRNPVHIYDTSGIYTVTLTGYNDSCSNNVAEIINVLSTGINSVDLSNALSIFPNPANGLITVSAIFNSAERIQVTVTNILGEIIYESVPVITSNQTFNLDLQSESKGIYFVQLKTNNGSVVKKLVLD